ncbi:MAG: carboxypeptidase-like regulatory domain-containing protein [Candidatus Zixiibacteriota bacterium]
MKKLIPMFILVIMLFMGCEEAVKELSTTISGTVKDDNVPVVGAYVFAMEGLTISDLASLDVSLSSGTKVLSDSGRYVIPELKPGTYQVFAIEDVNENNMIDYDIDRIGIYGETYEVGGTVFPMSFDAVTIANDGDDIENINIYEMANFPSL